jgi:hypothetical protein
MNRLVGLMPKSYLREARGVNRSAQGSLPLDKVGPSSIDSLN